MAEIAKEFAELKALWPSLEDLLVMCSDSVDSVLHESFDNDREVAKQAVLRLKNLVESMSAAAVWCNYARTLWEKQRHRMNAFIWEIL
eukprot:gene33048-42223_t